MFGNKHRKPALNSILENLKARLLDLKQLTESDNMLSKEMKKIVGNEIERCKADLCGLQVLYPDGLYDNISSIYSIGYNLRRYDDSYRNGTILSTFYPELWKNIQNSSRIEVFAGYTGDIDEDNDKEIEIPKYSYGVQLTLSTGEEIIHIFSSSGDCCLMNDLANELRKKSLNVVIAIVDDILYQIFMNGERINKNVDLRIRTEIPIDNFKVPNGWVVGDEEKKMMNLVLTPVKKVEIENVLPGKHVYISEFYGGKGINIDLFRTETEYSICIYADKDLLDRADSIFLDNMEVILSAQEAIEFIEKSRVML